MSDDTKSPSEAAEIEARLLEFIRGELLEPDTPVDREDDLLSGDLLDSMAALRLAMFVAEEFDFAVKPADYVVENFQTVTVLTRYIQRSTEQAG